MILTSVGCKPLDTLKSGGKVRVNSFDNDCLLVDLETGFVTIIRDAKISIGDTIIITGNFYISGSSNPFIGYFDI
jgi:hypothetical protein